MLVITFYNNNQQVVQIGDVLLTVTGKRGGGFSVAIDAPREIGVDRHTAQYNEDARVRIMEVRSKVSG